MSRPETPQCPELAPLITVTGHIDSIDYVQINEHIGPSIITASHDCYLKWWDLAYCRPLKAIKAHAASLYGMDISPSKTQLSSCSADKCIALWDSRNYSSITRIENAHNHAIYFVKYSTDTTLISCGRDRTIKVWDLRNLRHAKSVISDGRAYRSLDCKYPLVAAGSMDSHLKIFDQENGELIQKVDFQYDLSVFPRDAFYEDPPAIVHSIRFCNHQDGQLLTAHDDLAVRRLHMGEFKLNILQVERQHMDSVRHIEIAHDDSMFITTCQDGSVSLWDFARMQVYMKLTGSLQAVVRLMQSSSAMTSDCSTIVTGCYDRHIRIYRVPQG